MHICLTVYKFQKIQFCHATDGKTARHHRHHQHERYFSGKWKKTAGLRYTENILNIGHFIPVVQHGSGDGDCSCWVQLTSSICCDATVEYLGGDGDCCPIYSQGCLSATSARQGDGLRNHFAALVRLQ